mmetsp:Transcript_90538/g.201116  ORF Transcript_90538/g.201116 Transcript_90538/m.201116 type:complete len:224 (-) Transcript_90538:142-813(-)
MLVTQRLMLGHQIPVAGREQPILVAELLVEYPSGAMWERSCGSFRSIHRPVPLRPAIAGSHGRHRLRSRRVVLGLKHRREHGHPGSELVEVASRSCCRFAQRHIGDGLALHIGASGDVLALDVGASLALHIEDGLAGFHLSLAVTAPLRAGAHCQRKPTDGARPFRLVVGNRLQGTAWLGQISTGIGAHEPVGVLGLLMEQCGQHALDVVHEIVLLQVALRLG